MSLSHVSWRGNRLPLFATIGCLTLIGAERAAWAVAEDTYTQTSSCNSANTQWTITTTCVKTVGPGGGTALLTGVQFSPGLADPVVSITDDHGNPIFVNGAVLQLVPSDTATALVQSRYGTLSPQHVWRGFTTNVLLDYPDGASTATYIVTYTFPAPVEARGAVWTSDDADQRRGSIVVDGFNVLGPCTADFNHDNIVNSQDFFDFVTAFFAFAPAADFNGDGVINSQDFFDFVTAFFAGCP